MAISPRVIELAAAGSPRYAALLAWLEGRGPDPEGRGRPSPTVADPPLPSLATQATHAFGAFGRAASAALAGEPVRAPDAVHDSRMAICRACSNYRSEDARCSLCGCYLLEAKARLKTERCPVGRWEAYD